MFSKKRFLLLSIFILLASLLVFGCSSNDTSNNTSPADNNANNEAPLAEYIILATTTSTYDSGLLDYLLPVFENKHGIEVRVLSTGTGAALELGKRGDADILLVHDRNSELTLVQEGYFTDRFDVMYNDFVVVGPPADPAGVKNQTKVDEAFKIIAGGAHPFVSRGDDSGTNRKELSIWEGAGLTDRGSWYMSVGQGMGNTLRMASEAEGYTLTDRATYLSVKDNLELDIVLEGDPELFNQYGIMAVNQQMHSHVKYREAMMLIDFFMSNEGQNLIPSFNIAGETLFFPGKGVED